MNFGGSGGGPLGGSLDFINGSRRLSFQPGFGSLYFSGSTFGTYQGTTPVVTTPVPEPFTIRGLGAVGAIGCGAVFKRKLKQD